MIKQATQQKIDDQLAYAWETRRDDGATALQISQTCLQQSTELGYERGRALSLRNITRCYLDQNKTELALEYAQECVALLEASRDMEELAQIVNLVGEAHWELGDYPQALTHNLRTLQLAQKTNLRQMEALALNNLAMVYARLSQYDKVREMLMLSMPVFTELDDQSGYLYTLNNMAMVCLTCSEYEEAESYARRALAVAQQKNWRLHETIVLNTLGKILKAMGRLDEAEDTFLRGLMINDGEFQRNVCLTSLSLVRLYTEQERYEAALIYGRSALRIGETIHNQQLQYEAHQLLSTVHEMQGNAHAALRHLKQYHALQQIVHSKQNEREIVNLEVRYRTTAARKEAQILRQTNAELQYEIAERLRVESELVEAKNSAERAKLAAEAASRAKSEFLSNMSHELRTPLNGILGYAQILARTSSLGRDQLEGVKIIQHSGEHLLTLINDILDISKIEARRLELQNGELHLISFLDGIVGLMEMRAEQQGITLTFETQGELPRGIWVDEKRLRQVLINLLGNAIKFTERGGVSLQICSTLQANETAHLYFQVTDTGIGIAPTHLAEIFQPFEQVGNSQQRAAGTGLGLAISQRLVEAMNGEIQVESVLGEGSRFWFEIVVPLARAKQEVRPFLPPVVGYHGVPQTLLIVDDTTYNRLLLRSLLAPLGFDLLEAADGAEALSLSAEYKPDLIFLDLVLPDCNGLELVEQLRINAPAAAILAVSASIIDLNREMIVDAGCDDFLPKPIRVDDLLMLVHEFLDIEWIYENTPLAPSEIKFDPATDVCPSSVTLVKLLDLAMIGDLHSIERDALELQQRSPSLTPFAHQVIQLAREFEEESLTSLLQTCLATVESDPLLLTVALQN